MKIKEKKFALILSLACAALSLSGCKEVGDVLAPEPAKAVATDAAQLETEPAEPLAEDESLAAELYAMDTIMTLTAYGPNAPKALEDAKAEILRLDALISISSDSGDIYKINRDKEGDVSEDIQALLGRALEFSELTGGLFDCTIEPVMEAWGFTDQDYRVPEEEELKALLEYVDYKQVDFSGAHVKVPREVSLDLGGIAKGYTSARVMEIFAEDGVTSGIISLGGNVQSLGLKPDGKRWRVGIQDPENLNSLFAVVEVEDEAVITSGTYQRYFEQDGVIYHHIIDPENGYPSDKDLISVTIISDDGTLADALSTSLFIMGQDKAVAFWGEHRDEFDFILMNKDREVIITDGLKESISVSGDGKVKVVS